MNVALSGGGANGIFQAAVISHLKPEISGLYGISVGALNAAYLSQLGKNERWKLNNLWFRIGKEDVYKGSINVWNVTRLLFGRSYILNNSPLKKTIDKVIDPEKSFIPVAVGAVDINKGQYVEARVENGNVKIIVEGKTAYMYKANTENGKEAWKTMVLASTAIPGVFPPVEFKNMLLVDGGAYHLSPIKTLLNLSSDKDLLVINCRGYDYSNWDSSNKGLHIIARTADLVMNEMMRKDINKAIFINNNVENLPDYEKIKLTIIQPKEPLGDALDFSPEQQQRRWKMGYNYEYHD